MPVRDACSIPRLPWELYATSESSQFSSPANGIGLILATAPVRRCKTNLRSASDSRRIHCRPQERIECCYSAGICRVTLRPVDSEKESSMKVFLFGLLCLLTIGCGQAAETEAVTEATKVEASAPT